MSDAPKTSPDVQPPSSQVRGPDLARNVDLLLIAYIAFVLGFVVVIGPLVGVVIAYVKRDEVAGTWRESHCTWLIRTFWIGLLYSAVAAITTIIFVGFLLLVAVLVWYIIRLIKGWMAYSNEQPIKDVDNWLLG